MSAHEFADWQSEAVQSSIAGGQGSVVKVRHLRTGQYGALKSAGFPSWGPPDFLSWVPP